MNSKSNTTSKAIRTALGIAFVSSTMAAPLSAVAENPFVANDLGGGYQLASNATEGKCGEGKCGGDGAKADEGKSAEGKCGGDAEKSAEGKCGEGKCGG